MTQHRKAAFTLVELLVVITILSSLIGLAGMGVMRIIQAKNEANAQSSIALVRSAIASYQSANDEYPLDAGGGDHYCYCTNSSNDYNAPVFLKLLGRDDSGVRNANERSYLDPTNFKVYIPGRGVMSFQNAIDEGVVSSQMWVGFDLVFKRKNHNRDGSRVFQPINIHFDLDEGMYDVGLADQNNYNALIQL